jgi:hypothetical protein
MALTPHNFTMFGNIPDATPVTQSVGKLPVLQIGRTPTPALPPPSPPPLFSPQKSHYNESYNKGINAVQI